MEETLRKSMEVIRPLDEAAMEAARKRQMALAKPPGSLGRLEDLSVQLAGITGQVHNTVNRQHLWSLPRITAWWRKAFPVLPSPSP